MISVEKALSIISQEVKSIGVERIAIDEAVGRILAEDILADSDLPPFDRSQMDGFAVKASDTKNTPVQLKIVGESAAGSGWDGKVRRGEAVRIMTGAPVPAGADAVQKLELADETEGFVTINEPTEKGRYIVARGTEVELGTVVMRKGETINANSIAVPAAFGYAKLRVAKRPRVAILATGSEIVAVTKEPKKAQIRNSNSVMLAALCEASGAAVTQLPTVGDDLEALLSAIEAAGKESDILVITGGVSVGKYDLTKAVLVQLGATIFFEKLRLKPGKPTVFARLGKCSVLGLPGNPVSAAVTNYLFVRKAILLMQTSLSTDLPSGTAILETAVKAPAERDAYIPAALATDAQGRLIAVPLKWHGSSDLITFSRAEALVVISKGKTCAAGEAVAVKFL